jgi:hypothetical protein
MKNGIASSENEFTPLTVRCTIDINGMFRYRAVNTDDMNSVKVMGNFNNNRITKEPISMVVAVVGSDM